MVLSAFGLVARMRIWVVLAVAVSDVVEGAGLAGMRDVLYRMRDSANGHEGAACDGFLVGARHGRTGCSSMVTGCYIR